MSENETALVPQRKTLRILYHYRVGNSILAWHLFNIIGAGFGPRGAKAPKKPVFHLFTLNPVRFLISSCLYETYYFVFAT